MKRIKTLLAMLLCVAMLLSSAAFAASGTELSFNDILYTDENGEPMLDLGGVGLNLGFAENDGAIGLHLGLNANNESVADIQLTLQGNRLLMAMDGVSKVYSLDLASIIADSLGSSISLSEADLEALLTFVTDASGILANSVATGDDGITITIDVSEEQVDALLAALAKMLDTHPELFANSEYDSFSEVIADMDAKLSLQGSIVPTDAGFESSFYLIATDIESGEVSTLALIVAFDIVTENDTDQYDIYVNFGIGADKEEVVMSPYSAYIGLQYIDDQFDSFIFLAGTTTETGDMEEGFYFAYISPTFDSEKKWYVKTGTMDDSSLLSASCNMSDGNVTIKADDDTIEMGYAMENGEGIYKLVTDIDGVSNELSANGKLYNTEGEWLLPAETEAVDLMSLDEDGMNMLMMEALSAVLNALSAMGQANVLIGELVSSMMS